MKVGYARTSTIEQVAGIEGQKRELLAAGCEERFIVSEHASAVKKRDGLERALALLCEGDTLIVTKLDRLARSVSELHKIVAIINGKKAGLLILNMGIDTTNETGKLMLTMMGAFSEFEREIMLERQKEGIAKAKAAGKFKGRKPMPGEIKEAILNLASCNTPKVWISKKLSIGVASVYRVIAEEKKKAPVV